ncbi:MAG: hypothetical protein LBR11_00205 [Deltaproteobacteria bacterium]|jgi:hypothetical protein|nr:hypothetical protein [Deltaproteobacteria bacterium]
MAGFFGSLFNVFGSKKSTKPIDSPIKKLSDKNPKYHIGLFGPSRIGKTTLIASIVEEFKLLSDGLYNEASAYLKFSAMDQATSERIADRINALKSGIERRSFKTGTLEGTSSHEIFNMRLEDAKSSSFKLDFIFHDFPGGWINDPSKMEELGFNNWDIFILPTDGAALMESVREKHLESLRKNLAIHQVEDIIRDWARQRENLRGLCVIAPVKCETYYSKPAISPVLTDRSSDLYKKVVNEYYNGVLDVIKESKSQIDCLFLPVNTIGCCYLKKPTWDEKGMMTGEYSISPEPGKDKWTPFGPAHIMLEICKFMSGEYQKSYNLDAYPRIKSFINSIKLFENVLNHRPDKFDRLRKLK